MPNNNEALRVLGSLQRSINRGDVNELTEDQSALHDYLDDLQVQVASVHSPIERTWFLPVEVEPQAT